MLDFIGWLVQNICWAIAGIGLFFMFMDWIFDKIEIRKARQQEKKREYYERWKTIRKHF